MSPTPQDWEAAGFDVLYYDGINGWAALFGEWEVLARLHNVMADDKDSEPWSVLVWQPGDAADAEEGFFVRKGVTEQEAFAAAVWLAAVARQRDEDDA